MKIIKSNDTHLNLALKRLDIINYLIKDQRFPDNLNQRKYLSIHTFHES